MLPREREGGRLIWQALTGLGFGDHIWFLYFWLNQLDIASFTPFLCRSDCWYLCLYMGAIMHTRFKDDSGQGDCQTNISVSYSIKIFVMTAILLGCAVQVRAAKDSHNAKITVPQVSAEELQLAFKEYECFFVSTIESAIDRIDSNLDDAADRKAALRFQMQVIPACRELLKQESPLRAIVDVWHLAERMVAHFEAGTSGDDFADLAEHNTILLEASKKILTRTDALAKKYLPEECYTDSRAYVAALAKSNPIEGGYSGLSFRTAKSTKHKDSALDMILDVPLALFKITDEIGEISDEIDEGVLAIEEFTSVTDRFTDNIKYMPESLRWQMLLLLYDIETQLNLPVLHECLESLTGSTDALASTAGALHKDIRWIIDHIALRFAQLIGLIFVLTMVHILLSKRIRRPKASAAGSG